MKIPLFDNDGTLLRGGSGNKLHYDAFSFAFKEIYGIEAATSEIVADGMIDNQIIIEVVRLHGISEKEAKEKLPFAIQAMVEYCYAHQKNGNSTAMQGAKELLQTLKSQHIPIGVLTGNVEEIGWMKLKIAGLKEYIDFGSFGNLAMERVDLITIAQERYEKLFHEQWPRTDFVIVGDTPKDIACAREGGIQVIAVATGNYSKEELKEADIVLGSLEESTSILNFLTY